MAHHFGSCLSFPSALALLSSSGGERHFKPGEVRKAREDKEGDNTLEVVTLVSTAGYSSTPRLLVATAQSSSACMHIDRIADPLAKELDVASAVVCTCK